MTAPRRSHVVVALLALGALLLAAGSAGWAHGEVSTVLGAREVSVSGASAAPGVGAAALVVGAAALAAAVGRRAGAVVAGVALVGAAVLVAASVVGFLGDPAAPLEAAAGEISGVPELTGEARTALWPYVTLVLAAAVAAAGVVTLVAGRSWQSAGRRFERPATAERRSAASAATDERDRAMDDWDALGRGEDPSAGADGAGTGTGPRA
ncbi:Trp biosynthesis-associated membrane protein [Georgenia sp. EYE_87]|uniref:Trp biosynthesis-associated membrane protein n=1 Tax=Georgenia sp. EYE_87 TaxID=2853448 RepID=UPI002003BD0D|nr:Trp biosynthesis-associated membrane protein [Georgenia sp. EYE_87]MCK6209012.1 Trp biosynthesis-associated membrane protein [Georgenia sp. EYE_87]